MSDGERKTFQEAEAGCQDVRERQRLQAVRLYGTGWATAAIQEVVGCSWRAILKWSQHYQEAGLVGLKSKWQGGNACKLSLAERAEVVRKVQAYSPDELLATDRRQQTGSQWTVRDLQIILQEQYGVVYQSATSYRRLLHTCGLSYQRVATVYRSQPSQRALADFEAELEKN